MKPLTYEDGVEASRRAVLRVMRENDCYPSHDDDSIADLVRDIFDRIGSSPRGSAFEQEQEARGRLGEEAGPNAGVDPRTGLAMPFTTCDSYTQQRLECTLPEGHEGAHLVLWPEQSERFRLEAAAAMVPAIQSGASARRRREALQVSELERAWWVFRMPDATVYVPAATEQSARSLLASTCYRNAPVDSWPLKWTRICSRSALARELLERSRDVR